MQKDCLAIFCCTGSNLVKTGVLAEVKKNPREELRRNAVKSERCIVVIVFKTIKQRLWCLNKFDLKNFTKK